MLSDTQLAWAMGFLAIFVAFVALHYATEARKSIGIRFKTFEKNTIEKLSEKIEAIGERVDEIDHRLTEQIDVLHSLITNINKEDKKLMNSLKEDVKDVRSEIGDLDRRILSKCKKF